MSVTVIIRIEKVPNIYLLFFCRLERCNMLESIDFSEGLLEAFCQNEEEEYRLIAVDILNWVASIRMCRFRPIDEDISASQMNLAHAIEAKLGNIVQHGFIEGNRKLAHKITKLLIACSE